MEREALKLALEALGKAKRQIVHAKVAPHGCIGDAITAIKEALAQPSDSVEKPIDFELAYGEIYKDQRAALAKSLAQPAQEPVAWLTRDSVDGCWYATANKVGNDDKPLYTTPPQRTWVEPTGNEWFEWWRVSQVANETEAEIDFADFLIIAQAVAAKLKEENT